MKVEINHLTKVIQGNVVLDDINACFSCASGENGGRIYGIQGINGSGKTMLMRVICGLVLPTMGTVSIDGEINSLFHILAYHTTNGRLAALTA